LQNLAIINLMQRKILLSGHRGYRDLETENSWNAFKRAIDENIDYVEFDVKRTIDDVLVVFHDELLARLLHVNKRISKVSWDELRGYKYDDGQDVLRLEDFFQLAGKKIKYILEIKTKNIEKQVIALVEKYQLDDATIIQSFDGQSIKRCHELRPDLTYALCIGPARGSLGYRLLVKPYPVEFLNIDGPLVNDAFVTACVAHGKKIILGAQHTQEYLNKIESWNVHIINADNPGVIKQHLDEQRIAVQ
jgi:glycerophosphoryl diester phosphodiesterase